MIENEHTMMYNVIIHEMKYTTGLLVLAGAVVEVRQKPRLSVPPPPPSPAIPRIVLVIIHHLDPQ